MKKIVPLFVLFVAVLALAGCERRCRCYEHDGNVVYFSEDEVRATDGTCVNMREQAGQQFYYSLCEWEY
ncbi:MAG: lipoprotein [Bacteroidales bacterium]|nr:lipoprotein [Bacteroidales bacterium]